MNSTCLICHERPAAEGNECGACGPCMLADLRRLMSERNKAEGALAEQTARADKAERERDEAHQHAREQAKEYDRLLKQDREIAGQLIAKANHEYDAANLAVANMRARADKAERELSEARVAGEALRGALRDGEFAVGQLRHLYKQMIAGEVFDTARAAMFLLAPAIAQLEPLTTPRVLLHPEGTPATSEEEKK